jgi:hypothetical protein
MSAFFIISPPYVDIQNMGSLFLNRVKADIAPKALKPENQPLWGRKLIDI